MDYKLNISIHAEELLDNLIYYLLNKYDNVQAAKHLIDEMDKMYKRIIVSENEATKFMH